MGAMDALMWNLECIQGYLNVVDGMSIRTDKYEGWNQRERSEIIKDFMRRNYELGFTDKKKNNLYREPVLSDERVMEHAIPVGQWAELYLTAPDHMKRAIYFMAWCGPIVNVTAESNARLNKNGEAYSNLTPLHPFARYSRSGIDVRHEVDKGCVSGQPLRQHYEQMEMIAFMKPVVEYARTELNFEETLSWLENQFRQTPAQEPDAIAA
jgi:hypothetical protein